MGGKNSEARPMSSASSPLVHAWIPHHSNENNLYQCKWYNSMIQQHASFLVDKPSCCWLNQSNHPVLCFHKPPFLLCRPHFCCVNHHFPWLFPSRIQADPVTNWKSSAKQLPSKPAPLESGDFGVANLTPKTGRRSSENAAMTSKHGECHRGRLKA